MKKRAFIIVLGLTLLLLKTALAKQVALDGLKYNIENGVATVIGFEENTDTLVYHGQVEGFEVRYDGNALWESLSYQMPDHFRRIVFAEDVIAVPEAFMSGLPGVTEIVFSESVRRINHYALSAMWDLQSITFADGLEEIGSYTFTQCANLKKVFIPRTVRKIETGVFSSCVALTQIEVDGENPAYQTLEGGLYTKGAEQALVLLFNKEGEHFETAKGTTRILNDAFSLNDQFKSVNVSEGVTTIEEGVFWWLYELETLSLPQSLTDMEFREYDLSSLKRIDVAKGNPIFESRDGILYKYGQILYWPKQNRIHADIPFEGDIRVPAYLYNNAKIETASVGFGFEAVSQQAFSRCTSLKRIALPLGIQSIESGAFQNCVSLESIVLPPTLKTIGEYAFYNCASLKTVIIPSGVTELEAAAFNACQSLGSITIPKSVATIGSNAFLGCPKDMVIFGEEGSAAYYYAFANGHLFSSGGEAPYLISQSPMGIERAGIVNLSDGEAKAPLYTSASTRSKKIAAYQNGTTVSILEMDKKFAKVEVAGHTGYMEAGAIMETSDLTRLVQVKWGRRIGGEAGPGFMMYDTPFEDDTGILIEEDIILHILGTAGTWHYAYANGHVGYVQSNCLMTAIYLPTPTEKTYGVVYNPDYHDRLHLRKEPSTKAKSLGRYFSGTQVEVLEYGGEWCRVHVDGKEGYMRTEYLKLLVKEQDQYALFGNG